MFCSRLILPNCVPYPTFHFNADPAKLPVCTGIVDLAGSATIPGTHLITHLGWNLESKKSKRSKMKLLKEKTTGYLRGEILSV